jgi:hypothetical protein
VHANESAFELWKNVNEHLRRAEQQRAEQQHDAPPMTTGTSVR